MTFYKEPERSTDRILKTLIKLPFENKNENQRAYNLYRQNR